MRIYWDTKNTPYQCPNNVVVFSYKVLSVSCISYKALSLHEYILDSVINYVIKTTALQNFKLHTGVLCVFIGTLKIHQCPINVFLCL